MKYIIAIVMPFVVLLIYGKWINAIFNFAICILGLFLFFPLWIVAVAHAWIVLRGRAEDVRIKRLMDR